MQDTMVQGDFVDASPLGEGGCATVVLTKYHQPNNQGARQVVLKLAKVGSTHLSDLQSAWWSCVSAVCALDLRSVGTPSNVGKTTEFNSRPPLLLPTICVCNAASSHVLLMPQCASLLEPQLPEAFRHARSPFYL